MSHSVAVATFKNVRSWLGLHHLRLEGEHHQLGLCRGGQDLPAASILGVENPPTHPEDKGLAGNPWLGDQLPGHGCRGPVGANLHLTQPSGEPRAYQLHRQGSYLFGGLKPFPPCDAGYFTFFSS